MKKKTKKKKIWLWITIGVIVLVIGSIISLDLITKKLPGEESTSREDSLKEVLFDKDLIRSLINESVRFSNQGEWRKLYEYQSPNYREAMPYKKFADEMNLALMFLGGKTIEITDLKIQIKGSIAYLTYKIMADDKLLSSTTEGDEDLYIKYEDQWYDMEENPERCGWNIKDASVKWQVENVPQFVIEKEKKEHKDWEEIWCE